MKKGSLQKNLAALLAAALFSASLLTTFTSAEPLAQAAAESNEIALTSLPKNVQSLLRDNTTAETVQKDDDLYTITTKNQDGTYTATVFGVPVKYEKEDGTVDFIDTSMESVGVWNRVFGEYAYQNKANSLKAEYSNDSKTGIRLTDENFSFNMAPVTPKESQGNVSAKREPQKELADLGDAFVYENAFGAGTAVKYYNTSGGIKEDIVLERNVGRNQFDFIINTNGDLPVLTKDAQMIKVVDPDHPDQVKYTFSTLYAYDSYAQEQATSSEPSDETEKTENVSSQAVSSQAVSSEIASDGQWRTSSEENASSQPEESAPTEPSPPGTEEAPAADEKAPFDHFTEDCYYQLEDLGGSQYRVTVVVDQDWLDHPGLVYPVTIDPTVSAVSSATNIDDTYVRESAPNTNYYLESRLRIGNYNGTNYNSGKCHTFLRFITMPNLKNVTVTDATLTMRLLSGQTSAQPSRVWRVTSSWNGSSLTWNKHPSNSEESPIAYPQNLQTYQFKVGPIVNTWYNGMPNYGFLVNYHNAAYHDLNSLYSSDCGIASYYPKLSITYQTAAAIANGKYYIKNVWQGKYFDSVEPEEGRIAGRTTAWNFHGNTNQQWNVKRNSDGTYSLSPVSRPGFYLEVYQQVDTDTQPVTTSSHNPTASQAKWRIFKNSDGTYYLMPAFSKTRCLDVYGGTNTTKVYNNRSFPKRYGTDAQLCIYNGGSNQKWVFEKVNFGSAPSYSSIQTTTTGINCAGFALRINKFITGSLLGVSNWASVETVASKTVVYFQKEQPGRTIRRIPGINNTPTFSINNNEYRVALRVRKSATNTVYDYHYMIQTNDGRWAHKPGSTPSAVIGYINPSTYTWPNGYDSDVIYFAVSR